MVELIGVPFDGCGARYGSRLGPAAIRLAGLESSLENLVPEVADSGDSISPPLSQKVNALKDFDAALPVYHDVRDRVYKSLNGGNTPIVLGGDHSLSIGSVAGAIKHFGDDLAVLWVDAHADLNSPWTSPSGNLHGMVIGALMHRGDGQHAETSDWWDKLGHRQQLAEEQWNTLISEVVGSPALSMSNTGWFGLRDLDEGEQEWLRHENPGYVATMYDIDRFSAVTMVERISSWLQKCGAKNLWISFDVDCLDPILAPGTGTAVRGGLTYREMHVIGEMLYQSVLDQGHPFNLAGLDLVEINPLFDTNNETAKTAKEWIGSLFGKTILGSDRGTNL